VLQLPNGKNVLNCDMNNLVLSIILALRHYNYEAIAVGVGIAAIFIIRLIKGSNLLQGRTNTIQKVCILLCIVFFFATAGFGATPEIAAITTGLMVASFIGYFLFKDK
jgi:hypothetical protein